MESKVKASFSALDRKMEKKIESEFKLAQGHDTSYSWSSLAHVLVEL